MHNILVYNTSGKKNEKDRKRQLMMRGNIFVWFCKWKNDGRLSAFKDPFLLTQQNNDFVWAMGPSQRFNFPDFPAAMVAIGLSSDQWDVAKTNSFGTFPFTFLIYFFPGLRAWFP